MPAVILRKGGILMICPKCGKFVPDYSIYCWSCGQSLTPPERPAVVDVNAVKPIPFGKAGREAAGEEEEAAAASAAREETDFTSEEEYDLALAEESAFEDEFGAAQEEDFIVEDELEAPPEEDLAETGELEAVLEAGSIPEGHRLEAAPEEGSAGKESAPEKDKSGRRLKVLPEGKPFAKKGKLRLLAGVLLGLVALALVWALLLSPAARYSHAMNRAEDCMLLEDYSGALKNYTKAAAVRTTAEALQGQAVAWLNLGEPDQALECYQRLLKLDPTLEATYAAMADVYQAQGDYRQALNILDQGIQATHARRLEQQLQAMLDQLNITNYSAEEVAASANIWAIGAPNTDQAVTAGSVDIDVVAVFDPESGLLTVSRNGLDSDGVMADLCSYASQEGEAVTSYRPWLELPEEERPLISHAKISSGVVNIGAGAFSGCAGLESVSIGPDVAAIGQEAFAGCSALALVEIAEESLLTKVGPGAFRDCYAMSEIVLPDTVESLGRGCFSGSGITELTLPAALTLLSQGALNKCPQLETVNVNTAMTDLGLVPFYQCKKLQAINVAPDNRFYSSYDGVLYDESGSTLLRCPEGRMRCAFSDELTAIGDRAFYACANLTEADLPGGLDSIGWEAFAFCPLLSYVYLPASLTSIEGRAFAYCSSLSAFDLSRDSKYFKISGDLLLSADGSTLVCCPIASATGSSGGVLRLPRSVRTVAEGACVNCAMSGLVCTAVTTISSTAFGDCSDLDSVVMPPSVSSIGAGAFSGCGGLTIYCKTGSYAEEYAKTAGYEAHSVNDFVLNIFNGTGNETGKDEKKENAPGTQAPVTPAP